MRILVYRFGLLPPIAHGDLVREQIRDAHTMRNRHVEIERDRRDAHREAMSAYDGIRVLEQQIAEADDAERAALLRLQAARSERRNKRDTAQDADAHRAARARKKELLRQHREMRAALRADVAAQMAADAANEAASKARRLARAEFSRRGQRMVPGTYMLIESAAEQAAKAPLYDGIEPNDPSFKPWRGEGRIGQQIHDGAIESMPSHGFARIVPASGREDAPDCCTCRRVNPQGHGYSCPPKRERTNGCARNCPVVDESRGAAEHAELWLAIRVDPKTHERTWARFPMIMHREIPAGSVVTFAAVSLRKIGPREEWSTELTVRVPDSESCRAASGSAVAIDVGWRLIGDEIRVASWVATDGERGELRLSAIDVSAIRKADALQSTRKRNMNEALDRLCSWLRERDEMPEWMRARASNREYDAEGKEIAKATPTKAQAIAHLMQWEAQGKLASLVRTWAVNRFDGDAEAYGALESWRYHDFHLWNWEASQRSGALRRRRDLYRRFAREMSDRYETVVLEDFDLRVFARRAPKESQATENATARSNRQLVALSELRLYLSNRFAGGRAVKAPSRDTTRRCHVCGMIEKFNAAEERTHSCENGHTWDQDENAAENLLMIWRERPGDCKTTGTARSDENVNEDGEVKEGRRAKSRRLAAERRARLGTAREAADNAAE